MDIQIDPFASSVAGVSVIISIYALFAAKRAPLQERTRNHRDIVRNALIEATRCIEPLETALRMGVAIPELPDELAAARRAIAGYGNRLPEHRTTLMLLDVKLEGLRSRWKGALSDEATVARTQKQATDLEEWASAGGRELERHHTDLAKLREELERAKRALTASQQELREALKETKSAANKYIREWDRQDRRVG